MNALPDRNYVSLRPRERFHLAVSAAARKDFAEVDRLVDTCPEKSYRMRDDGFMRPMRAFAELAHENKADLMRKIVAGLTVFTLLGYAEGEDGEESVAQVGEAFDKARAMIRSTMEAWDRFCDEISITPEERPAFAAEADELLSFPLSLLDMENAEADPEMVNKQLAKLRERWETLR